MGGAFPGFGKKHDASYIEKYAFEKRCDQDDRRTWSLTVYYAEYGKPGNDHTEYGTAEIWRGSVCGIHVDPYEYHADDHNSGAGDHAGDTADHQL